MGNYKVAQTIYAEIGEDYPKSRQAPEAYYWAGLISYLYLKESQKSLNFFLKVLNDYPASEFVLLSRGYLAEMYEKEFNEPRLAIAEYQKLIEETPDHKNEEEYLYKIGGIYFNQGDLFQSKTEWENLIKKYPEGKWSEQATFQIAMMPIILQKYDEGLKNMESFITTFPKSSFWSEAKYERALCLEELNRYDDAIKALQDILPVYSNHQLIEMEIKRIERLKGKNLLPEQVVPPGNPPASTDP